MSRNFEEEYRQMIDSELPDLWARIEAQLPKGTASVPADMVKDANGQTAYAPETDGHKAAAGRTKRFHFRWMPMAAAGAAAVLCVLVALPVLFLSKSGESDSLTNSAEPEDGFSGGAMEVQMAADNSCEPDSMEPADWYYADENKEAAEDASFDAEDQAADTGSAAPREPALGDNMQQDAVSAPEENNGLLGAQAESSIEQEDGFYQVEVRILECITKEDGEVYYEAAVCQEDHNSDKDIMIYFRAAGDGEEQNGSTDVSFSQGEKYVLSLYRSGETLESYGIEAEKEEVFGMEMYIVYEVIGKYFHF